MSDGFGRSAREEAEYHKIVWPGTEIYQNKLGIRDAAELERAERMILSQRVESGFPEDCTPYSYVGFRAMHRHMFQDIYEWAGEERKYTTARGPAPFARPERINDWMQKQFSTLTPREMFQMRRDRFGFSKTAAALVNEINAAHPFIDGNGRARRQWLRALSKDMGYSLDIRSEDRKRWNDASRIGFVDSNHDPMRDILSDRLTTRPRTHDHQR
ncbi:putative adenosine monophosphate-protein transferase y4lH [Roseobacter cerasinus]|uniref:protein adenylyltransferase n=1 Tax=Roseobacter cerasinus TaxID=2602289 RepID=A0A640VVT3_9RHOB|nr:Fic family protein [Roseobacter cerasinus]GFE52528.1 putative adenosine monophosphate-protein transferase y4lH [Roseobacter cerasinus]